MSNAATITGWVLSALISIIFLIGAYSQFTFDVSAEANQSAVQFPA